MNSTITNLNGKGATITGNTGNQDGTSQIGETIVRQANNNEKVCKRRESFFSALMRVLSSVSF
jgi:hypothetical protein